MKNIIKVLYNVVFYTFISVLIVFSIVSFSANEYKSVKKIGNFAFVMYLQGV